MSVPAATARRSCIPAATGGHLLLTVGEAEAPGDSDTFIDCGVYDVESNLVGDVESIHVNELRAWIESTLAARQTKA